MRSSLHQRRVKDDRVGDDEHVARPLRSLLARVSTSKRFNPRQLRDAVLDLHARSPIHPGLLAQVYQSVVFEAAGMSRKRAGVYYTPPPLVRLLVEQALPARADTPSALNRHDSPPNVLDPACGCGAFLVATLERLGADSLEHVYGIDIDPVAAELCRISMAIASGRLDSFRQLERQIRCCDAIADDPVSLRSRLGVENGFDVILTNPPFVNAIENASVRTYRAEVGAMHPLVTGAADYSSYSLSQSTRLIRAGGKVGMILPRASLNSRSLADLRANLPPHLRPNLIVAPEDSSFFPGAQVFICALVLGSDRQCRVATSIHLDDLRLSRCQTNNWWEAVQRSASVAKVTAAASTVESEFEVHASMTTADAYDVRASVVDCALGAGQKLVTTGLIDPGVCKWGREECRYLGRDYRCPRVVLSKAATDSLKRRLERSKRPKILVAGLSKRIECFVDAGGECVGAVSTFSIFHPHDDVQALTRLANVLSSRDASRLFVQQLGGNAMGGGNTTMKREFLRRFPLRSVRLAG
jgi:predicted RNA methylase